MKGTLVLELVAILGACNAEKFNVSAVLDKLVQRHDIRIRPNWGGEAVLVNVSMYFLRIFDISTHDQSVSTDFYFRQSWFDPRLAFDAPPGTGNITLGAQAAQYFWEPDTFIPDGETKFAHDNNIYFKISPEGKVLKTFRVLARTKLNMDLSHFPFDKHSFTLTFESYAYKTQDMVYRWKDRKNSVAMSSEFKEHDISILNFELGSPMLFLPFGNFSRLFVKFNMARHSGYYVRHFHLPSMIALLIVWISFWFHPSLGLIRILFVFFPFMSLGYLLEQTSNYIPQVDYSTMLEKYLVFGLVMSALAIGECALVLCLYSRFRSSRLSESGQNLQLVEGEIKDSRKKQDFVVDDASRNPSSYIPRNTPYQYIMAICKHSPSYEKVDIFCRAAFPFLYVIYNLWYWTAVP